jgi:TolB-like protein
MQISMKMPQCLRLALIGGITLTTPVAAQQQESFDVGIAGVAEALAQRLGGQTVAIFEFPDLEGRVTNLSRLVSEQLTTELVQRLVGRGRVLERRQVLQVLTELNLQKTDLTAAEVSRVGRQLGADAIVLGSATTIGDQVVVNARAVRVTGGEVVTANRMNITGSQNLVALATSGIGAPSLIPSTSRTSSTTPSTAPRPTPPRPQFRVQESTVTVDLTQCSQDGSRMTCTFVLTNSGPEERFDIRWGWTRMYDQAGNVYGVEQSRIANAEREAVLVQSVPTRATIVFGKVEATTSIPLLEIFSSFHGDRWFRFRNIPVSR